MSVILRKGVFGNYYANTYDSSGYLTNDQMETNALYIYSYLKHENFSDNSIAAMLGNMEAESGINPGRWQSKIVGGNSEGHGYSLTQWTPYTKYTEWCSSNGYSDPSEMDSALARIIYEVKNNIQWIGTGMYSYMSFEEFATSTLSVSKLSTAFLLCYERPVDQSESVQLYRSSLANKWYSYLSKFSKNSQIIEDAISWAVSIANDDSHGYDQNNRWGPDYDCSSLVIQAFENAGCSVKTNGATYTGDMESVFVKTGFQSITYTSNDNLIRGDVLLRDGHTALYMGNGQIVSAHINENGEVTGGQTGDQTSNEIDVSSYISTNWNVVLRLPISEIPSSSSRFRKKNKFKFILFNKRRRMII